MISHAVRSIRSNGTPRTTAITHRHANHIGSLGRLVADSGAQVYSRPLEAPFIRGDSPDYLSFRGKASPKALATLAGVVVPRSAEPATVNPFAQGRQCAQSYSLAPSESHLVRMLREFAAYYNAIAPTAVWICIRPDRVHSAPPDRSSPGQSWRSPSRLLESRVNSYPVLPSHNHRREDS
jgi:hypothetical protein